MHEFTQKYYDDIMEYVALNQRCVGLMATTKYTGLVRWHNRNHEVYDGFNEKITKYIANMYDEYAEPKPITMSAYRMPNDIMAHLKTWHGALEPMKISTYNMYKEACEIGDFILADMFKCLNKVVNNELFTLKRVMWRLNGVSVDSIMYVNKLIHDYFENEPNCKEIDISL